MSWTTRLAEARVLILDGGTGSELRRRGVELDPGAWSALANITAPTVVQSIHEDFIRAGADIITTNTFGCARFLLETAAAPPPIAATVDRAVAAAHAARAQTGADHVLIAGSMSNLPPHFDRSAYPDRSRERADYVELATRLAGAGVDLLILEMLQDQEHAGLLLEAAQQTGLPVAAGIAVRTDPVEDDLVGYDVSDESFVETLEGVLGMGPDLVGVMHSAPADVVRACDIIRDQYVGPLGIYPELPVDGEDNALATATEDWLEFNPTVLGGCCGTRPDQIAVLRNRVSRIQRGTD